MVELKCDGLTQAEAEALVAEAVRLIRAAGMEGACALACSEFAPLRRSKELAPGLDTVYIGEGLPPELESLDWVDGYSIHLSGLDAGGAARVRAGGKKLYVWTANGTEEMARALELGVDGLVTDDPEAAAELLRARGVRGEGR